MNCTQSMNSLQKSSERLVKDLDGKMSEDDKTLKNGDAVKLLTSKMYQSQNPKEIKIERESGSRIKPVCDLKLGKDDKYDTLVDKFLNTRPEDDELPKIEIQSSSFDLKEAINPKDDLSEIMKAFDFYGGNDEE